MDKILKKAGLSNTSKVIGAATDVKNKSIKRMWNIFIGAMFFGLGILCLYGVLWSTTLIFTEPFGFVILGYLFGLALLALLGIFMFGAAFACFSTKSDWFLILYEDYLLYKFKSEGSTASNPYEQIKVPIKDIERCSILCEYRRDVKNTSNYYMSVHFQYTENDEKKYISLYRLDGYQEVNQILNHLATVEDVPMFFATAHQELGEELNDIASISGADPIIFSGNLKDYNKGLFLE